jgi:beta-glucosidase
MFKSFFVTVVCCTTLIQLHAQTAPKPVEPDTSAGMPFRDTHRSRPARVDDLVHRLTIPEKIGLLGMDSAAVPRLGVPAYHWWSEGLHGIARDGVATVFPQAIGLAATWDQTLHHQVAGIIAEEARAKNNAVIAKTGGSSKTYQGLTIWSPNINIFRDPRWGRGQETYGEDPFLTSRFAIAFVTGLQGNDPNYLETVATVKHFAVHSGAEIDRHRFDAVVSDRDLHETYLPAFEAGIREGHARSLMSAYNAVDGIPMPANKFLLTTTLRDQWGFSGAVVGDVDTVGDIVGGHHYAKDIAEASALALKAGNDLCSGTSYARGLPDALKRGLVTEANLDVALRRLLSLRFELGQFDPASMVKYRAIPESVVASDANDAVALKTAQESVTLLKNDGTLPWEMKKIHTLAVIGPTADDINAVIGNYAGSPKNPITILKGLRSALESHGIKIVYDPAIPLVTGYRQHGQPIPNGVLFTDESKATPGLKGELFDNSKFTGKPTAVRTDQQLDLYWNPAEPAPSIPLNNVHARWTGVIVAPATADYALSIDFVGLASLYVDDKLIAGETKANKPNQARSSSTGVHLEAGHAYKIRIEYNEGPSDTAGKIQLGWKSPADSTKLMAELQSADHILLALGITSSLEGEESHLEIDGFSHGDRTSIQLPRVQQELIARVAALHKPFTVILTGSSSLVFDITQPNAILMAWYYGQSGGTAIADILLGKTNPSGHLPVTFYASDSSLPPFEDYAMKDRTYRYFTGKPLYPFGYGLSYTSFAVQSATSSQPSMTATGSTNVTATVKNNGTMSGDAVVQVYAHAIHPPVDMPQEWLVGFQRVTLAPGMSKSVEMPLAPQRLQRWDDKKNAYIVDPGEYELRIGQSSASAEQRVRLTVR